VGVLPGNAGECDIV